MTFSDLIAIVQTLLAVGAFIFAYAEFKKWRIELLGSKKIELALRLGRSALEVRQAFKSSRSPFGFYSKYPEHDREGTPDYERERKEAKEREFNGRLERVDKSLRELRDIQWEMSLLFDDIESVDVEVNVYMSKFKELRSAFIKIYYNRDAENDINIAYSSLDSDDEFDKIINDSTEKILVYARKYTQ